MKDLFTHIFANSGSICIKPTFNNLQTILLISSSGKHIKYSIFVFFFKYFFGLAEKRSATFLPSLACCQYSIYPVARLTKNFVAEIFPLDGAEIF